MKKKEPNYLLIFFGVSVAIHLLFFLALAEATLLAHLLHINTTQPSQKEMETPRLVLLQTKKQPEQFVETDASQETKERPKQTPFYSDRNTLAADQSQKQDQNRPEIKGRNKDGLVTADVILAKNTPPSLPANPKPAPPEKPKPPAEKNPPSPSPEELAKKQFAMLQPKAIEATAVKPEEIPVEAEAVEPSELLTPNQARGPPLPPSNPSLRSIPAEASTLTGGISRKGVISFDTQASPAGYYDKILIQAISQRWYLLVGDRYRNQGGNVRVEFSLLSNGQVSGILVQPDDSVGPVLANYCRQAILESAPYRPFPTTLQVIWGDTRRIKITFQYSF